MGLLNMDLHVYVYMQRKTSWKAETKMSPIVTSAQWDYERLIFFLLFNLNFLKFLQ